MVAAALLHPIGERLGRVHRVLMREQRALRHLPDKEGDRLSNQYGTGHGFELGASGQAAILL